MTRGVFTTRDVPDIQLLSGYPAYFSTIWISGIKPTVIIWLDCLILYNTASDMGGDFDTV